MSIMGWASCPVSLVLPVDKLVEEILERLKMVPEAEWEEAITEIITTTLANFDSGLGGRMVRELVGQ